MTQPDAAQNLATLFLASDAKPAISLYLYFFFVPPQDPVSYYLLRTFQNSLVRPSSTVYTQSLWPHLHHSSRFLLLPSVCMFLVFWALKPPKCPSAVWPGALSFPHGVLFRCCCTSPELAGTGPLEALLSHAPS